MNRIGVDIIEIARIEKAVNRYGLSFLKRIYSENEIELYQGRLPSLAARFAAKEAVIKALSTTGLKPNEIEVLSDNNGKPTLFLHGKTKEKYDELGIESIEVSLSHAREYAVAFVSAW